MKKQLKDKLSSLYHAKISKFQAKFDGRGANVNIANVEAMQGKLWEGNGSSM